MKYKSSNMNIQHKMNQENCNSGLVTFYAVSYTHLTLPTILRV